jgi:FkbM family methyltransferase
VSNLFSIALSTLAPIVRRLKPRRRHLGHPFFRIPLRWAVRNGWAGDYYTSGIPVKNPFSVRFPTGEHFLYSMTEPEGIGEALYWKGALSTEPDVAPVFLSYARKAAGFIDVGANTGFYSMLAHAANKNIRIWAFEPNPAVYRKLEHHIRINDMTKCCQPYAMALGESSGAVKLQVPADATMAHIVGENDDGILVDIQPLDLAVPEQDTVDLVKIDVEGHELAVFRGMRRILSQQRPPVFFECLPGSPSLEMEELLGAAGYRLYHLRTGVQPEPVHHLDPENRTSHNFLALPG